MAWKRSRARSQSTGISKWNVNLIDAVAARLATDFTGGGHADGGPGRKGDPSQAKGRGRQAEGHFHQSQQVLSPGDWLCICKFSNFAWRDACFKCFSARPDWEPKQVQAPAGRQKTNTKRHRRKRRDLKRPRKTI